MDRQSVEVEGENASETLHLISFFYCGMLQLIIRITTKFTIGIMYFQGQLAQCPGDEKSLVSCAPLEHANHSFRTPTMAVDVRNFVLLNYFIWHVERCTCM